jgi:hypothetical protein
MVTAEVSTWMLGARERFAADGPFEGIVTIARSLPDDRYRFGTNDREVQRRPNGDGLKAWRREPSRELQIGWGNCRART